MGSQLHTVNVLLGDDHVEYILNDAADEVLLVDPGDPFETVERLWDSLEHVEEIVVMDERVPETDLPARSYEALLEDANSEFEWPESLG